MFTSHRPRRRFCPAVDYLPTRLTPGGGGDASPMDPTDVPPSDVCPMDPTDTTTQTTCTTQTTTSTTAC